MNIKIYNKYVLFIIIYFVGIDNIEVSAKHTRTHTRAHKHATHKTQTFIKSYKFHTRPFSIRSFSLRIFFFHGNCDLCTSDFTPHPVDDGVYYIIFVAGDFFFLASQYTVCNKSDFFFLIRNHLFSALFSIKPSHLGGWRSNDAVERRCDGGLESTRWPCIYRVIY